MKLQKDFIHFSLTILFVFLISDLSFANSISEAGGSNYVFVKQSDFTNVPMESGCGVEGHRSIFSVYHRAKALINRRLAQMRATGQNKLAFIVWHFEDNDGKSYPEDMLCFQVKTTNGQLNPQHATNIEDLIKAAANAGFNEIQIRLSPYRSNAPEWWKVFDANKVDINWKTIQHVHQIADKALSQISGAKPRIIYDLGLELGGLWNVPKSWRSIDNGDIVYRYVHAIWNAYLDKYGIQDTVGFSISASKYTVAGSHEFYMNENRGIPPYLALDIYGSLENPSSFSSALEEIIDELKGRGLMDRAFIQETFFNSEEIRQTIDRVTSQKNVKFRTMIQWPIKLGGDSIADNSNVVPFDQYVSNVTFSLEDQDLIHPDVFNAQWYLNHYSDLKDSYGNDLEAATEHWINIGVYEGRQGSPYFFAKEYLQIYKDLSASLGNDQYRLAVQHYVRLGIAEGRVGRTALQLSVFNIHWYLSAYSDLKLLFGNDSTAAKEHWLNFGISEGRRGRP